MLNTLSRPFDTFSLLTEKDWFMYYSLSELVVTYEILRNVTIIITQTQPTRKNKHDTTNKHKSNNTQMYTFITMTHIQYSGIFYESSPPSSNLFYQSGILPILPILVNWSTI